MISIIFSANPTIPWGVSDVVCEVFVGRESHIG